jgi:hypothetical protein
MEAPPPYMAPPRKSKTGLIIGLILGGVVLCCVLPIGGLFGLGFWGLGKMKGTIGCSAAFSDLQNAFQDYADAHDGKLPKATTWMDDVRPFYREHLNSHGAKAGPFDFMPAEGTFQCTTENEGHTGIAYNTDVAGKAIKDIKKPRETILIYETQTPSANLAKKYTAQDDSTSPKFMGQPRGWMTAPVQGKPNTGKFDMEANGTNIKVNPK